MRIIALLLLAGCTQVAARSPMERAVAWLWSQQGADGGWHSETYGLMRSGRALTPFVLDALMQSPGAPPGGVERALEFIRKRVDPDGAIGRDGDLLEYPNYATAYALRCLMRRGNPDDRKLIRRMRGYLLSEQYREATGFERIHPAYGGWGFGGRHPKGRTGHMDLSHVRAVLQALGPTDRAQVFLRRMQNEDGGFFFTPIALPANKGRGKGSYATATCDGVLSLLAAGVRLDDRRVRAARDWLFSNAGLDRPAGIPEGRQPDWGPEVHHYHLAMRAEAHDRLGWPRGMKRAMLRMLTRSQRGDGSFSSDHFLMKEDEPLIATPLALIALQRLRAFSG